MFCSYFAIKYFPLVLVSLVSNITPLLVAVFSYILYRVGLSKMDIANLIISFLGVAILITGGQNQNQGEQI
jgi:drug/metabolite transporter (DMT)-like permease